MSEIHQLDKHKQQLKPPSLYHVVLLNDDFTPMDFVVFILEKLFNHDDTTANAIMLEVHEKGKGIAGTYSKDIAETKVNRVNETAQLNDFPLKATIEQSE